MKEFKVKKNLSVRPYIIGLPLNLFYIFLIVLIVNLFFQLGSFGLIKLSISTIVVLGAYFILKLLDGDSINKMGNEKFPDVVIVDNF